MRSGPKIGWILDGAGEGRPPTPEERADDEFLLRLMRWRSGTQVGFGRRRRSRKAR